MQQSKPPNPTSSKFSVEVLTEEGLWALHESQSPKSDPKHTQSRDAWPRWAMRLSCAALTIALHGMLLSSILFGTTGRPYVPPLSDGAPASAQNTDAGEFVSTLVILNDHSITDPDTQLDSAYEVLVKELDKAPQKDMVIAQLASISQPEVSGSEEGKDADAPPIEATGDDAGHAKLFGQYMDQIKARVERGWEQPSSPINGKFQCRVEIRQDDRGEVREVTLQRCNGNSAWQLSLVQAIQRASPLPAPPMPTVFSSVLTLSFDALSPQKLVSVPAP